MAAYHKVGIRSEGLWTGLTEAGQMGGSLMALKGRGEADDPAQPLRRGVTGCLGWQLHGSYLHLSGCFHPLVTGEGIEVPGYLRSRSQGEAGMSVNQHLWSLNPCALCYIMLFQKNTVHPSTMRVWTALTWCVSIASSLIIQVEEFQVFVDMKLFKKKSLMAILSGLVRSGLQMEVIYWNEVMCFQERRRSNQGQLQWPPSQAFLSFRLGICSLQCDPCGNISAQLVVTAEHGISGLIPKAMRQAPAMEHSESWSLRHTASLSS